MARRACSASLFSVVQVSSGMRASLVALNPSEDFLLAEAPVLPDSITGELL